MPVSSALMNPELVRPDVLGARLKTARSLARLTQVQVAEKIGIARTTLVAIELGKRQVAAAELRRFAELYSVAESELLSGGKASLAMEVKFRSQVDDAHSPEESEAAALLNRLAEASVEIEALVGGSRSMAELPLVIFARDLDLDDQAEDAATSIRQRLGIGIGPIQDLVSLMETDLGIRVFERPLPGKISGAVAFDDEHGGFVLLNANHPWSRRRLTAAHELCHLLVRLSGLRVHFEGDRSQTLEDKFCDAFARAFLMPAAAVRKRFADFKAIARDFTVRHLLTLSVYFNVSIEAVARRLESLKLVVKGTFDSLKDQGLGTKHLNAVRKELGAPEEPPRFTPRIYLLAGVAYDRKQLSEQQLARMLQLSILTVREMLSDVSAAGGGAIEPIG